MTRSTTSAAGLVGMLLLVVSAGANADTCTDLTSATDLTSTCVPGAAATCTLAAGTNYSVKAANGTSATSPLPPLIVPATSAICITNAAPGAPVSLFAQSIWLQGGTLQIGTATDPITAANQVTITMTGSTSAAGAPRPICVQDGSTNGCSPIATNSYNAANARDITVSAGGQLLMYGAKGLTPVAGASGNYIHNVDYTGGTVDGAALAGDINQLPYFNNLSGSRSWTYLRYPAGPVYFNTDMQVQAPVALSNYGTLLDTAALTPAATQPAAADTPYLVALSNMVADGHMTDWQPGDWVSIATTTFSPHETEMVQVCQVFAMANPDSALPSALSTAYGDVTGPSALPNLTVLVLAGSPSYKSTCAALGDTPLKHYHFGSQAPTPGFFTSDAPTGYPKAETGQAYSLYDGDDHNFGIDERAEVALLSRSIKLTSTAGSGTGDPIPNLADQYFGGHIAVMNHDPNAAGGGAGTGSHHNMAGSAPSVKVELVGVELEKFGQPLVGRYPVHMHRLNADTTSEDSNLLLVQDSVVHHSFNKCYVVHDTEAAQFYNNSCVRSIGQAFYMEDGHNIAGNNFVRNHVAGAMAAALIYDMSKQHVYNGASEIGFNTYWDGDYLAQTTGFNYDPAKVPDASDSGANTGNFIDSVAPSGFWITTFGAEGTSDPRPNVFVNNSVAGCQIGGSAYWFVRQDVANGAGGMATTAEADLYPVFTGNRGHACYNGVMAGTNFAALNITADKGAPPKPVPIGSPVNKNANAPAAIFDSMTMTQIENKAFWYRGVFVGVTNSRFSALKQGMTLLGGGGPEGNLLGFWGLVHNSSFAGVTNNNVGRYADCEGYYEQIGTGALTLPANMALPIELYNEMAKCTPIDMSNPVSSSGIPTASNGSSLFGAIVTAFNFQGYTFYDGPARMENNRFINFRADPTNTAPYDNATNSYDSSKTRFLVTTVDAYRMLNYRKAGQFADIAFEWGADAYYGAEGDAAFSWLKGNQQSVPPTQYATGNMWENVNFKHQVFTEISNLQAPLQDGDKQTVEIDKDTTLSGYSLCAAKDTSICSTATGANSANHYPISLNNLDIFQTPYTIDEPQTRGRNNVISTALMSPHKYATINVGAASQECMGTLSEDPVKCSGNLNVTRDMPAHDGATAQTTMTGRGGLGYMYEAMVMNNMGYSFSTSNFNTSTVGLLFSYSDAPVDTDFINRVGICVGTGATAITVKKTPRQWNSGVNYLGKSPYWSTATYGLTDTSATCPSVVTEAGAFATCQSNGTAVDAYASAQDLNTQYLNVLKANFNPKTKKGKKKAPAFTEGYYYDPASGMLYFNMMQAAETSGPIKPVTPPYGTCDSASYSGATGTRAGVTNYLKYSDPTSIGSTLDVACYAESGTPATSSLLTCPTGGCSVYTVGVTVANTSPTCTTPDLAPIDNGTKPGMNTGTNAVTYSAPYLLYNAASTSALTSTPVSVQVTGTGTTSLTRNSRYEPNGIDTTVPPAASALLPLAAPIYVTTPPPAAQPAIALGQAEPGGVTVLEFGQVPQPTGPLWQLSTGASTSAGQSATLTAAAGTDFNQGASPYTKESSVSISATASGASQQFYYSGTTATLKIGTAPACTLAFSGTAVTVTTPASGTCPSLTISGTSLQIGEPPTPPGPLWYLVTSTSPADGQSAILTPIGTDKFQAGTPPYGKETSVAIEANTVNPSQSFYYSGAQASLQIGSQAACTVNFSGTTVTAAGTCPGLQTNGTTMTILAAAK